MKLLANTIVGLVLIGSLVGCNSNQNTNKPGPKPKVQKVVSALDVVNALKNEGLPIGNQLVYTVENDPNKLLGQPGQYTSKVNFIDTTAEEDKKVEMLNGGSVEMFVNNTDAKDRYDYISKVAKSKPLYNEYDFVQGKILLRLSKNLTPDHVKKYKDALKKITP